MNLQKTNNIDLHGVIPDLDCNLRYSILIDKPDLSELDTDRDITMYGILVEKECRGEISGASVHNITSKREYISELLEKLVRASVTLVSLKYVIEDELQK